MRNLKRKEPDTNHYSQQSGQYPNYVNGHVNYPPKPQARKKAAYKKKGGKRKMARKRGGKSGSMLKLGSLNLLGVGFFFAVIYFSTMVNAFIQSTWSSLNLPDLGSYTTILFAALTAIVFYIIAKQLMAAKILRL